MKLAGVGFCAGKRLFAQHSGAIQGKRGAAWAERNPVKLTSYLSPVPKNGLFPAKALHRNKSDKG
jgi:hypothetical protein